MGQESKGSRSVALVEGLGRDRAGLLKRDGDLTHTHTHTRINIWHLIICTRRRGHGASEVRHAVKVVGIRVKGENTGRGSNAGFLQGVGRSRGNRCRRQGSTSRVAGRFRVQKNFFLGLKMVFFTIR